VSFHHGGEQRAVYQQNQRLLISTALYSGGTIPHSTVFATWLIAPALAPHSLHREQQRTKTATKQYRHGERTLLAIPAAETDTNVNVYDLVVVGGE
jgi:hypothetical protein